MYWIKAGNLPSFFILVLYSLICICYIRIYKLKKYGFRIYTYDTYVCVYQSICLWCNDIFWDNFENDSMDYISWKFMDFICENYSRISNVLFGRI